MLYTLNNNNNKKTYLRFVRNYGTFVIDKEKTKRVSLKRYITIYK